MIAVVYGAFEIANVALRRLGCKKCYAYDAVAVAIPALKLLLYVMSAVAVSPDPVTVAVQGVCAEPV